ncbi:hypothetical protein [Sphingomonas asaccharolytica]|uniref:hypothetical protein n=1 Tax=Sphingomonas asaccharolytica TaxID=40681 RepID=UPI000830A1B1|nr:hypothetical protein [Sphingomonas asaccharolytica]
MSSATPPSINDFLDRLYVLQRDASEQARDEAKAITARNAARGLLRSGPTLKALTGMIEQQFETTLDEMLASLRQVRSLEGREYQTFRDQTFLRARDLIAMLIGAADLEKWHGMIGRGAATNVIEKRLERLYPHLDYRMQQFDVGLDRAARAGGNAVTNNVVRAHIISGVVQQGGDGATQTAWADLDLGKIADATAALKAEIAQAGDEQSDDLRQIASDVATIEAQIAAPKPRTSAVREAGASIRHVAEQAIGGALSPGIITAALALGALTG